MVGLDQPNQLPSPTIPIGDPPPLPFEDPNILGKERVPAVDEPAVELPGDPLEIPELTRQSALACLVTGRPVYGIALANTNVRTEPAVNSCRIGRAPRGTLLRIDGIYEQGDLSRLTSLQREVVLSEAELDEITANTDDASQEESTASATEVPTTESLVMAFQAAAASKRTEETAEDATVGYEEDILPLFERSCSACHSEIAQTSGLVVTDYEALLEGSDNGAVVVPGSVDGSMLWWQIFTNKMPVVGSLSDEDKELIRTWIDTGAPERRSNQEETASTTSGLADLLAEQPAAQEQVEATPTVRREIENIWLELNEDDFDDVPNSCSYDPEVPHTLVSGDLIRLISCGVEPSEAMLTRIRDDLEQGTAPVIAAAPPAASPLSSSEAAPSTSFASPVGNYAGITAAPLGVGPPLDSDEFMVPKANFCMEPRYMKLQDNKSITAMAFAPDGRLFFAVDDMPTGRDVDPLILLDANHPSRYIGVIDSNTGGGYVEILRERGRITGLDYYNGALYVSLAGEVGVIPDGQEYKTLAGGFAVASQYFHANNGIVVSDGWLYVSAGGIRDGWSDGPIVGMDENGAMHVVTGGNPWASRIVRAPLDVITRDRNINNFETASRGWRNPYGLARGPDGRLWVTDNGATNVPDGTSAGDEVNVFDPRTVAPGTPDGETPYFGFPLSLTNGNPGWYTEPVIQLPNAGAPTGITWAYGTIFYGQYGVQPGLYRLAQGGGGTIAERVMMGWPIVSLATAPDGSLWIGMGTGGIYRFAQC